MIYSEQYLYDNFGLVMSVDINEAGNENYIAVKDISSAVWLRTESSDIDEAIKDVVDELGSMYLLPSDTSYNACLPHKMHNAINSIIEDNKNESSIVSSKCKMMDKLFYKYLRLIAKPIRDTSDVKYCVYSKMLSIKWITSANSFVNINFSSDNAIFIQEKGNENKVVKIKMIDVNDKFILSLHKSLSM